MAAADNTQQDQQAKQQASVQALEAGKLPVAAQDRITAMRSGTDGWTSDLTTQEFASIRHAGFDPLGMVMGSCVMHIAAQWGYALNYVNPGESRIYPCTHQFTAVLGNVGYYGSGSDDRGGGPMYALATSFGEHLPGINWQHATYEAGLTAARDLALRRLMEEAAGLSAHGVVGVEVRISRMADLANTLEMTMIGTAVTRPGAPLPKMPFTSHLDGQAFAKAIHGGYVPVRLVIGVGALEIDPGCITEYQAQSWNNQEMQQLSEGAAMGRMLAINHLDHEVQAANADGCVGVTVQSEFYELRNEARLMEVICIGTAVRHYTGPAVRNPKASAKRHHTGRAVRHYTDAPLDALPSGILRLK